MTWPVLKIEEPYTPEFLAQAAAHIENYLNEDMTVFEYGSGYSTVWLALQVNRVYTVEHEPQWAAETERALRDVKKWSKVNLILRDKDNMADAIDTYGMFDLVLVDCWDFERVEAVRHSMEHVHPGGLLVLDDSEWPLLKEAKEMLAVAGWQKVTYTGDHKRKSGEVRYRETSVYKRPGEKSPVLAEIESLVGEDEEE